MATIRKRNNRWQVMIRRKDAPQISRTFHRKVEAEAWAREIEVEADRGHLKNDPRILNRITFGDLMRRYADTISMEKAGAQIEGYVIDAFLKNPLSQRTLGSLQPSDFTAYRDLRLSEVSGSTVNRQFTIFHHAFEIAVKEWGLPLQSNPLNLIRRPKNNPPRARRLKNGEYSALLTAADQSRNKLIKMIVTLAVETAMRRGEILNIQRGHIDLRLHQLRIPKTKTGEPRTIPLSETAVRVLPERLLAISGEDQPLFPITANAFRLAWERTKKRAGIEDLHFHDLRHEAISRLFEQGLGVAHVAAISGHKDFRMLARYTHINPKLPSSLY